MGLGFRGLGLQPSSGGRRLKHNLTLGIPRDIPTAAIFAHTTEGEQALGKGLDGLHLGLKNLRFKVW